MPQLESDPVSTMRRPLSSAPFADELVAPSALSGGLGCGLLLASLDDGGYPLRPRHELSAGLAASALVELAFLRRVGVDGKRLLVTDSSATGDAVVDPVLAFLATRRRAPDLDRCIEELSLDWTILGRAGGALEARGLVRIERRALHPLILHRFHPLPAERSAELRAWLGSILEGTATAAAPRDSALASLAEATGLIGIGRSAISDGSAALGTPAHEPDAIEGSQVLSQVRVALLSARGRRRNARARGLTASP